MIVLSMTLLKVNYDLESLEKRENYLEFYTTPPLFVPDSMLGTNGENDE